MKIFRGLLLLCLFLFGCSDPKNFLYQHQNLVPQEVNRTYKVKEMEGKSNVDILWSIDNSGSMGDEQTELINHTQTFIQELSKGTGLSWKLGMVSTDLTDPPYVGFLSHDILDWMTADPVSKFQAAVAKLGTWGDSTERSFQAAKQALDTYPQFHRPNAALVYIMVSDEEEQSYSISVDDMYQYLLTLVKSPAELVVYGAISASDFGCSGGTTYAGSKYEGLIQKTVGKNFSLCGTSAGTELAKLGQDIREYLLRPRVYLQERPRVDSIRVLFHGVNLPGGPQEEGGYWFYDVGINAILFHDLNFAAGNNETVTVVYEIY